MFKKKKPVPATPPVVADDVPPIPPTPKPRLRFSYQCPKCATWNETKDEACLRCAEEEARGAKA